MPPSPAKRDLPRHYVVVRTDISGVQRIVQVGHACAMAGALFGTTGATLIVLLGVPDEHALLAADEHIGSWGIPHVTYEDPDLPGHSAICTAAIPAMSIFGCYSLLPAAYP